MFSQLYNDRLTTHRRQYPNLSKGRSRQNHSLVWFDSGIKTENIFINNTCQPFPANRVDPTTMERQLFC